jgi:hypothetical protein
MKLFITGISFLFFSITSINSLAAPLNLSASVVGATAAATATPTPAPTPLPPVKLGFLYPSQTVGVGKCSGFARAETLNANNQQVNVTENTVVTLTGSSGMTFYEDAACTEEETSITIAAGSAYRHYYFKSTVAGDREVIISNPKLTIDQQTEAIVDPTWNILFSTAAQRVVEDHCSAVVTIETRNDLNQVADVTANTTIALSGTNLKFFSNSTCTDTITSATIAKGSDSAKFYFESATKGSDTITASTSGYQSGTQTETITDPAASLKFTTAAQTLLSGHCSAAVGVETLDSSGTPTNVTSNTVVSIAGSPALFYSNSTCTTAITSVTIPSGSDSAQFYFKDSSSGNLPIAISTGSFASQQQNETVTLSASLLAFNTGAQTVVDGVCSNALQVQTRDTSGNPTNVTASTVVSISGSPALFYSDSACSKQISSVTIGSGADSASFYFKDGTQGNVAVTLSATNFSSTSQTETISPQPQHQVSLSWKASTSTGITGYHVYRGTQNAGPYNSLTTTTSSELSYVDSAVSDGDTYYYVVTAIDSENIESSDSNQATAAIPAP